MNQKKANEVNKWGRRAVIRALGIGAAAPFIPVLEADAQTAAPLRVCFITTPNGISTEVIPTGSETNYEFQRVLAPLQEHKGDVTYLHGVDMKTYFDAATPNDHPPVVNQLLTAAASINPNDGSNPAVSKSWLSSGISIDQFLSQRLMADNSTATRFSSIVAGVNTQQFAWKQVFRAPQEAIFPEINTRNLHARIFDGVRPSNAAPSVPDPNLVRKLEQDQSVIDSVRDELNAVLTRVSSADKRKIEAHLESIREVERRLNFTNVNTAGSGGAECTIPTIQTEGGTPEDLYRGRGENMMDTIAHAFACNQTRVATLQWSNGASNETFPSIGVSEQHHGLTHENFTSNANKRALIGAWYGERLRYFIDKLKAIPEGNGTLFDNTLLVWTSEHSDFDQHSRVNLPYVLAGGLGGRIAKGRFFDYSNNKRAHNDVYVTIAQAMGFTDVETFGKARGNNGSAISEGPLPGLLV